MEGIEWIPLKIAGREIRVILALIELIKDAIITLIMAIRFITEIMPCNL